MIMVPRNSPSWFCYVLAYAIRSSTYMLSAKVLKSSTWVPNTRYPSCAYARNMMKNMMANPAMSFEQRDKVDCSCVIVRLKLKRKRSINLN